MGKKLTDWNLLLCVVFLDLNLAGSCPAGWFGPECSYMCHCSDNSQCDLTTGECSPGVDCGKGFFGPGCQFADVLAEMGSLNNSKFLVDGIKSTCNPDPKATSLTVSLNHSTIIYWLRIHTDVDMSNRGMSVLIGNQTCPVFRLHRVSEKILDVTCNSSAVVTQLVIKGPIVGHMCDLEISGGWNVALKEWAVQSGNYPDNANGKAEPKNAVDGNRNAEFEDGSCSLTINDQPNPSWYLALKKNKIIFRIVIYNRNKFQDYLDGFMLEIYEQYYGTIIANITPKVNASAIYYINLPSMPSVKRIRVKKKQDNDWDKNYLALCEVELYTQYFCNKSFYNLYCNQTCSCEANRSCHPATGVCGTPCVTGTNGLECSYPCHPNCLDNQCRDGECVSCKKGFKGAYCEEADICPAGMYGTNCTLYCSKNCLDSKCNKTTGHCLACEGKQLLPLCGKEPGGDADICPAGKYGTRCTLNCPKNCLDSKCNKTTGHCPACVGKQLLPLCDYDADGPFLYFYQLLPLLPLIPLCLCCFCCWKRRTNKPVVEETSRHAGQPKQQRSNELGELVDKGSSVDSD